MRLSTIGLSAGTAVVLVATTTSGAVAHPRPDPAPTPRPWTTVASGLDNPRLLSWSDGSLYVAEAGRGGSGPCIEGPEGNTCLGATGAVTRVSTWTKHRSKKHGWKHDRRARTTQKRVLTGLPSLANAEGNQAIGPTDVLVSGKRYTLSIGLGLDPSLRTTLGSGADLLGTLVTGKVAYRGKHGRWHRGHGAHPGSTDPTLLADLAAFEAANDPDGAGPDSNPTGMTATHKAVVITDSGGNSLLRVAKDGSVSVLATFPTTKVPAPPPPIAPEGTPDIDMDAVPTSVVKGSDGAYYVSQLTGFPFPAGGASIFRVVPGQAPTVYATGLTNVTDLAWHNGKLYVVQLADNGLLAAGENLPVGSLRKINRDGTTKVVAGELQAPYGVAFSDKAAYVTTCAVCAGGGSVVKIPLW